jgi:hypothetical protein
VRQTLTKSTVENQRILGFAIRITGLFDECPGTDRERGPEEDLSKDLSDD